MEEWSWFNGLPMGLQRMIAYVFWISPFFVIVLFCFYLPNLSRLLKAIRPVNRKIAPILVWFLILGFLNYLVELLPFFIGLSSIAKMILQYLILGGAMLWLAYIAFNISISLSAEYFSRGMFIKQMPTMIKAVVYCTAQLAQMLLMIHSPDSKFMFVVWLWVMISWIAYWAETAKYKKQLRSLPATPDRDTQLFHNLY